MSNIDEEKGRGRKIKRRRLDRSDETVTTLAIFHQMKMSYQLISIKR